MAVDRIALDKALTRDLGGLGAFDLHFRLGDAFLPAGSALPADARLRCCTCGFAFSGGTPTPCPLCGSRAWELLPTLVAR
jgi:hypothetical protein